MKRKFTFLSIVFCALLATSCTDNNYELGQKQFERKNYSNAKVLYNRVSSDDENYELAQSKIVEIEKIQAQITGDEAIQDSISRIEIEKTELENLRSQVKREIESLKTFDGNKYRGDVNSIQMEVMLFSVWAKVILDAENSTDEDIVKDGKKMRKTLGSLQKTEYPKLRKSYGDFIKKELWPENIDVLTKGNGASTLEFIGASFANNKNKKEFQETLSSILNQLRFKRVNYKWFKLDDEYTYYTLDVPEDAELVDL